MANNKDKNTKEIDPIKIVLAFTIIMFLILIFSNLFNFIGCDPAILTLILWIVFAIIFLFLIPLANFTSKGKKNKIYIKENIILVLRAIVTLASIYSVYSIFYKPYGYINNNKYFFNTIFYLDFLLIIMTLINILKDQVLDAKKKSKSIPSFLGRLVLILITVISIIATVNSIYDSKKVISLENIKKPSSIYIYEDSFKKIGEISNENLINDFYDEIANLNVENMRNIDKLYYIAMRKKADLYCRLKPSYGSNELALFEDKSLDDRFIQGMYIYDNGEFYIVDNDSEITFLNILFNNSKFDYYKLDLSDDLTNRIIEAINTLDAE